MICPISNCYYYFGTILILEMTPRIMCIGMDQRDYFSRNVILKNIVVLLTVFGDAPLVSNVCDASI